MGGSGHFDSEELGSARPKTNKKPGHPELTSEHYMQDLADEYVGALVNVHNAAKVVLALMEKACIFKMLQLKPEVSEVRKKMRRADGSSMGVFADSLVQEACWKAKLDTYLSSTSAAEIHLSKMKEVKAFLERRSLRAEPRTVTLLVRDLGFLHSELPAEAFQQFMAEGLAYSKDYWTQSHGALCNGIWQHDQQQLQECMTECNLVWPDESCFSEAVQQLGHLAAAKSGQTKIADFMACLEPMVENLKEQELLVDAVEQVRKHSRVCRGMAMNEEQQKTVQVTIDTLQAAALCSWGGGDAAPEILEMCECLEPWFAKDQGAKLVVMQLYEALAKSFVTWKALGSKMSSLKEGPEREALAELVRTYKAGADRVNEAGNSDWGKKELMSVKVTAGKELEETEKMIVEQTKAEMEKQGQKVQELMCLTGCGEKSWTESITATMGWEEVAAAASRTLAKIPSDRLELETKDLYEVSLVCKMGEHVLEPNCLPFHQKSFSPGGNGGFLGLKFWVSQLGLP